MLVAPSKGRLWYILLFNWRYSNWCLWLYALEYMIAGGSFPEGSAIGAALDADNILTIKQVKEMFLEAIPSENI